jgi:hypothetical protein
MQIDNAVLNRIESLMARARTSSGTTIDEARTSAYIAIQEMAKHGLTLPAIRAEREKLERLETDLIEAIQIAKNEIAVRNMTVSQMAFELGRRGGLKGGHARAKRLSPERRLEISRKANLAKAIKRSGKQRRRV